jgi:acetyl esterase/lipase
LLIAGESAGADIALAAAYLWANGKKTPPLTGVYSAATSSASPDTVPDRFKSQFVSIHEHANAPVMSAETMDFIKSEYSRSPLSFYRAAANSAYIVKASIDPM